MKKGLVCLALLATTICVFAQTTKNIVISFDAEPSEIRKDAKLAKEWAIEYFSQIPEWKVLPRDEDFDALLKEIKLGLVAGTSEDGSKQLRSARYILRGTLLSFEANEPQNICLKMIDCSNGNVVCAVSDAIKPRDRLAIEGQITLMLQKYSEKPDVTIIEPAIVSQSPDQLAGIVTPSTVNVDRREPVSICFVIDNSGSMGWNDPAKNMKDTKRARAIEVLIGMMEAGDEAGFVMFSDTAKTVRIGTGHIERIRTDESSSQKNKFVSTVRKQLLSSGQTNIEKAFEKSFEVMAAATNNKKNVIFLTDGSPTAGDTNIASLTQKAKRYTNENVGLFCIGLGSFGTNDLDRGFLSTIAANTKPSYYITADSPDSLPVFMQQITSILLDRTALCSGIGQIRQNKEEYCFTLDNQVGEEIFVYIQHQPGAEFNFYYNDMPVVDVVEINKKSDFKQFKINVKARFGSWRVERLLSTGIGKVELFKNSLFNIALNSIRKSQRIYMWETGKMQPTSNTYEIAGMFKNIPMDDSVKASYFAVTSKSELKITSQGLKSQYEVNNPIRFVVNVGPVNVEDRLDINVNINRQGWSEPKTIKPRKQELGTAYYEFRPDEAGYYSFVVSVKGSRNVHGEREPFERQLSLGGAEVIAPQKPIEAPKEEPKPVNEYVIVKGDCLWKIVNKLAVQGIKITTRKLYLLNKIVIGDNPNLIEIGRPLKYQ